MPELPWNRDGILRLLSDLQAFAKMAKATNIVQKALDIFLPLKVPRVSTLSFASERSRIAAIRLFEFVRTCGDLTPAQFEEARQIIEAHPGTDIFYIANWDGYTLLQHAIMNNQITLIKEFLKKGCDVNAGICSLPLHLACSLGYDVIVQLLLSSGAKADIKSTVCHPSVHNLKTFPDQIQCLTYKPVYTPILYALSHDHEPVVRLLLYHENSKLQVSTDFIIHEASRMEAHECLKYLLKYFPQQIQQEERNLSGLVPVQICLVKGNSEGAGIIENEDKEICEKDFLLDEMGSVMHVFYHNYRVKDKKNKKTNDRIMTEADKEAEKKRREESEVKDKKKDKIMTESEKKRREEEEESLRRKKEEMMESETKPQAKPPDPIQIRSFTEYAIKKGFRLHINARDVSGNTALFILLRSVGRTVQTNYQQAYDQEVLETIEILLKNGASPNVSNRVGEMALHSVLADTSTRPLHVMRHGQIRRLKNVVHEVCKAVKVLLAHGADTGQKVSLQGQPFTQPIFYATRIYETLLPEMFVMVKYPMKELLLLLCTENCDINVTDSYGLSPYLHLLVASNRMISHNLGNVPVAKAITIFLMDILEAYIKNGLNVNAQFLYSSRRMDETIDTSYYREFILLFNLDIPECPLYYENIKTCFLMLLENGGNPNMLSFAPSYGTRPSLSGVVPDHGSVSLLLTRALYIYSDQRFPIILAIFKSFFVTLTDRKLRELHDAMDHYITVDFKTSTHVFPAQATAYLQSMLCPRSLKLSARYVIVECFKRKRIILENNKQVLPLPPPLQAFCRDIDIAGDWELGKI